jgi:hypothetical protein
VIWSETPPTKSGWYWVKLTNRKDHFPVWTSGDKWVCGGILSPERMARGYLFGPPIPSPEQCAEIAKGGGA